MKAGQGQFLRVKGGTALPAALHGSVVAIGNFDGVHLGHRAVLDAARAKAAQVLSPSLVLTFEPHPRTFFNPAEPVFRLTGIDEKARLFAEAGFDGMVEQEFDAAFAAMPASFFVYRLLAQELKASHVVAGMDFHFGKARFGTPQYLVERAGEAGIGVTLVEPVRDADGAVISSTRVREALAAGDVVAAARLLGRWWQVSGEIVGGRQLGRTLGYPTANMALAPSSRLRHGIYAVRVQRQDGTWHDGVASYGRRPTFDNGAALLETFLFDFTDNLYGEILTVEPRAFLREEEKFDNLEALVAQMDRDSQAARAILSSRES